MGLAQEKKELITAAQYKRAQGVTRFPEGRSTRGRPPKGPLALPHIADPESSRAVKYVIRKWDVPRHSAVLWRGTPCGRIARCSLSRWLEHNRLPPRFCLKWC